MIIIVVILKSTEMGLPVLVKCCGCVPLERGCVILAVIAIAACVIHIIAGAWNLPSHRVRKPEDNLISMSTVMFATLSAITNIILLAGICLRRPGFVQLSILFNLLFMVFAFLIAVVTILFSPEFKYYIGHSVINTLITVIVLIIGAAFSFYFILVTNSLYRRMKSGYTESVIPV